MKKSLLMTGATGLVGSRFVELYGDTYEIYNMDLTTGVDITKIDSIQEFVKDHHAESLIHLAAATDTNKAFAEKGDEDGITYKVNVEGTRNIASICKEFGIHLVHISTDFVFDGEKKEPYTEEDKRSPIEWYGETKALAEVEVEKSGVDYCILRLSYPYRREFAAKPDLVKKIRLGLESGKLYPQFTDTLITPTFIDDLARAFHEAVSRKAQGIFHTVGSTSLSPYELAVKVAEHYGFDPSVVKKGSLTEYLKTSPRPFARYAALSNDKASREFEMQFATIDEGLAKMIEGD